MTSRWSLPTALRFSNGSTFDPTSEGNLIDHGTLDWEHVAVATYRIEQRFRYEYPGPIFDLKHRLVLLPRTEHADQRRLSRSLRVVPNENVRTELDRFGNEVVTFSAPRIDGAFEILLEATVERSRSSHEHRVGIQSLRHPGYRRHTALTEADRAIGQAAARLRARHQSDRDLAEAIVAYVHRRIVYTKGVTHVGTSAAEAFAVRRGVCQDYAHVAIAIARACGLAARYVSGHLLGEGATHAWIEFLFETPGGAVAVSYDPTYGGPTTLRYVVIAVGRDYRDVAPTSGVYRSPHIGRLDARTHVHVEDVRYA